MFPELSSRQDEYRRRFPKFARPRIVGFLSLDGTRRLLHDTSRLKFVRRADDCRVTFDLNRDLDLAAVHADQKREEKISHLLQYLLGQEIRLHWLLAEERKCLDEARFFSYRGLLTCVANTPYESQDGWRIVATLHCGHIFLCELRTDEARRRREQMTEKELQCTSWGYKFEQYLVCDRPDSSPDASTPLNQHEEFSLVLSTELSGHRLLYAAEMDGIRCDGDNMRSPPAATEGDEAILNYLTDKKFIELKTNRRFEFPKQEVSFKRFKARKWWAQSFLAGVDTILCGIRDDRGLVEQLKFYNVSDLPRMCSRFWSPDVCFNFLETFLTFVKRCLAREVARLHGDRCLRNVHAIPTTTLHFEWSPHGRVRVTDNYDPQEDAILPDWFLNSYAKNREV